MFPPVYAFVSDVSYNKYRKALGCTHEIVETASSSFAITGREVETDVWSRIDIKRVKARVTNITMVRFLERTFD